MWSDTQFEIIKRYVENFEPSLNQEHEAELMLTNFEQSILTQVTEIGYPRSVPEKPKAKIGLRMNDEEWNTPNSPVAVKNNYNRAGAITERNYLLL